MIDERVSKLKKEEKNSFFSHQITAQDLQYLEILGHGSGGTVYRYDTGDEVGGRSGGLLNLVFVSLLQIISHSIKSDNGCQGNNM